MKPQSSQPQLSVILSCSRTVWRVLMRVCGKWESFHHFQFFAFWKSIPENFFHRNHIMCLVGANFFIICINIYLILSYLSRLHKSNSNINLLFFHHFDLSWVESRSRLPHRNRCNWMLDVADDNGGVVVIDWLKWIQVRYDVKSENQ